MPTPALPRRAAAYVRVSTDDQAELSPDSQLEEIRKYAHREGMLLLDEYIYIDAGISGKKAERRPEFMRMIAQAKEDCRPFSVILLWKFSRFARNQEESIFYKSVLRSKCGVEVVSVTEPLTAGPFGSLIERIIEWMDEFYSIRLSQEVKRSMTVNARRGKLQASPAFGYRADGGKLIPLPDEAAHVRRIFDRFVSGSGIWNIAQELNSLGLRTHRGNPFENRTVEYILRNPVYIGKLRWNPSGRSRRDFLDESVIIADGGHEPLVSPEVWEAAQDRLDRLKAQFSRKARPAGELKHWLSGLVRCSACGGPLIFSRPHYFKCNNYVRARCPRSQHVNAELLSESVRLRLEKDASSAPAFAYELTGAAASDADQAGLEAALRQLRAKKARLLEAYLSGALALPEFTNAKRALDGSIDRTRQELDAGRAETAGDAEASDLRASIDGALKTFRSPDAPVERQNLAARSVLEACVFDKEASTLTIVYRLTV